jgi:iron(III) transport system ATP-binding protein
LVWGRQIENKSGRKKMTDTTLLESKNDSAVSVRLEDINLSFGKTHVLKGIDLQIDPGEFFAFLGPSGCGKTTLLRLIAGFESAQTGRVIIGEKEVSYLPPWQRNLGMVFQSYALWPHMTIRKNVAFGLEERHVPRSEINRRTDQALDLVGLLELADRRPSQLSGGQQQRVALARTIVIEPQVLLLDEPLSNLDAKLRVQMRHELLDLQRKLSITTIFVTHDQEEANTTADRIALMKDGVIQQVGTPVELYDKPVNRFVADFLGTANFFEGKLEKSGDTWLFQADNDLVVPLSDSGAERIAGSCCLVFRPHNARVTVNVENNGDDTIQLQGTVSGKEFLGSTIRYRVNVHGKDVFADVVHQQGRNLIENGTTVNLGIQQDQIKIVGD